MKVNKLLVPGCMLAIFLIMGSTTNESTPHELQGSWTMIKYKQGTSSELSELPGFITYVKHLTNTHFSWASYNEEGNLIAGGGGTYEVKGDKYTEYIDYFHPLGSNLAGSSIEFDFSLSGNDWMISGWGKNIQINPGSGQYEEVDSVLLEEVWRRL